MKNLSARAALLSCMLAVVPLACAPRATTSTRTDSNVVTAADIEKFPGEPLERVLVRKISGLQLMRTPDGSNVLVVRGVTSYKGDIHPPIYVINETRVQGGPNGEMPNIDPKDVESVRVLKGADAGLYGIDGANGVILITTKGARRS